MDAGYKCTLAFHVGRRGPGGYHAVDGVLIRLPGGDEIDITPSRGLTVDIEGMPDTPDNLVHRALRLVTETVGERPPVRVRLVKRVPWGAGLGGGSADAGAVLRWAMDRWPRYREALRTGAAQLGADVPLVVEPWDAARVTGRGDILTPIPPPARGTLVVIYPGFPVATKDVYRAYDEHDVEGTGKGSGVADEGSGRADDARGSAPVRVGAAAPVAEVVDALVHGVLPSQVGNALERAAWRVAPRLRAFRLTLEQAGAPPALTTLSGSGSSYVVWFPEADQNRVDTFLAHIRHEAAWVRWHHFGRERED
jgi:4-diphosphocytidyl-2C-methyl-D-erythritol kinase